MRHAAEGALHKGEEVLHRAEGASKELLHKAEHAVEGVAHKVGCCGFLGRVLCSSECERARGAARSQVRQRPG